MKTIGRDQNTRARDQRHLVIYNTLTIKLTRVVSLHAGPVATSARPTMIWDALLPFFDPAELRIFNIRYSLAG